MNSRRPTGKEWKAILAAIGTTGVQPAEYLPEWIRIKREMCARLQDCAQRHGLGLGGEKVDGLLIAELDRMSKSKSMSMSMSMTDGI